MNCGGGMSKGWRVALIAVTLVLGSVLLIKSANTVCGHEFMHVSICGHIPAFVALQPYGAH